MIPLHNWEREEVDTLIDIWKASVPELNEQQKLLLKQVSYDPRHDHITRRFVLSNPLINWMQATSERRGFPFNRQQTEELFMGRVRYS